MSVVMLCRVSSDLVPYIESMENELLHGVGSVRMEPYELASRIISDVPSAEGQVEPSDEDMPDEAEVQRLLQEAEKLRKETEEEKELKERLQKRQEEVEREKQKAVQEAQRIEKKKKEIEQRKQKEEQLKREKAKIEKKIGK